jgi:hypothetical protein
MKVHFLEPTPRFGRANNRLHIGHQQRSPYYWWWAYLRRNTDYLACCAAGGGGELAGLYADFGDVREDNFHAWWKSNDRAIRLFAEQPLSIGFGELDTPNDWQPHWTKEEVVVLAVPLRISKRRLKGLFSKMLDQRHAGKQGRPAVALQKSTAKYKLARNYTIRNLQTTLEIYDLWHANQQLPIEQQKTLWQLGVVAGLNKQAAKDAVSDSTQDRLVGRNHLGALVGRYMRQAKKMIANTALGQFPVH